MFEGKHEFYVVQARNMASSMPQYRKWYDISCAALLFEDLPYKQANGLQGDHYRALLRGGHDVWSVTGSPPECSYWTAEEAIAVIEEIIKRKHPRYIHFEFRVAFRVTSKETAPVATRVWKAA
ncbi:MAG: hypothetical protein KGL39_24455 [Patescibacteria group bacterium]|nr:hypothetical protein [Patescibacteria group bacterium]